MGTEEICFALSARQRPLLRDKGTGKPRSQTEFHGLKATTSEYSSVTVYAAGQ